MCGSTSGQKDAANNAASFASTASAQAGQVFGFASGIFNDLNSAFAPILASGPGQLGWSPAEAAARDANVIDTEGQAAKNARAATGSAVAAAGGNMVLPSGTAAAIEAGTANEFAQRTASGLQKNKDLNYEQGQLNFNEAAQALGNAPGVFGASTSATGAATNAEGVNISAQNNVAEANNSWMTPVAGILGGVTSVATAGLSKGGAWNPNKSG